MWHQWFNSNVMKLREYLLCAKKKYRLYSTISSLPCQFPFFLPFWDLNVVVALLSIQGQKALWFHQKHLNLCSEDEQRSYGFRMTWGWVMKYNFCFIFRWSIPLKCNPVTIICNNPLKMNIKHFDGRLVPKKWSKARNTPGMCNI